MWPTLYPYPKARTSPNPEPLTPKVVFVDGSERDLNLDVWTGLTHPERLARFKAVAGIADDGYAASFLETHSWDAESALNSFFGDSGGGDLGGGLGGGSGGGSSDADMAAAAEAPNLQEPVDQPPDHAAHPLCFTGSFEQVRVRERAR